ncbi:helix-turn-helix domain-containing protein [Paenibacillus xylanilyticus]|uniref:helix-turn-helix domain-containing protein n=1 Tax=Paenibacillus xylanilyticus TaxID=248903 RepID=UPI0039A34777
MIEQLKTFVQVVESGSFSKAAEKLFISSTAVMKQMNLLEKQAGVPLLSVPTTVLASQRQEQFLSKMRNICCSIFKNLLFACITPHRPIGMLFGWVLLCLTPTRF